MKTLTVMLFLLAMLVAVAAMPTNVYQICAWNVGTLAVESWRTKAVHLSRSVAQGLRTWFAGLWGPRLAFGCLAVLLAVMIAHMSAGDGVLLANVPAIVALQATRTRLLGECESLRNADKTFKDDASRALFDAKMTEVEGVDAQIRTLESVPPAADPDASTRAAAAATQLERDRVVGIQAAVRASKLEASVADDMIKRGITLDAARAEVLAKLATASDAQLDPNAGRLGIRTGEDASDKFRRGVSAWIFQKAGVSDFIRAAAKAKPDHPAFAGLTFEPGEFRGMSLLDLAKEALERAGVKYRGKDKMEIAGLALRGGMQTTSDFAVALENVLNKTLLSAYSIAPDTWRRFCAVGTVSDFRAHPRYRTGYLGRLDRVRENGEFNNKAIPDASKESLTAGTFGNIIALTRQAIINDDMGVFSRIAMQVGRAAALSIELDVYDLIKLNAGLGPLMNDGVALFNAAHGNINATGSALTVAGIDADRVVMASQKDPANNEVLDIRPAILLVPIGLGGEARVINSAEFDTDAIANKFMKPNKVRGLFRDIVDTPQLTGTRRYLFADPAAMPVLEVAFLEGNQEPFLEVRDGWRIDGVEWKVRSDYAVGAVEVRGAVTNAGV